MPLSPGMMLNNRYRIVRLLGQGGFGAVYRAWDMNLNGPCALKENFDTSQEAQTQFAREASILYNLRHSALPRVIDHFSVAGQGQYLVMEFIEGEDLQEIIDLAGGPLPVERVLPWMAQVCDALIYLHSQNPAVVHRDIKPSNVRITPQGQAMLVDFGIAKLYDPGRKTTLGARAATPGYAPIEQYGQGSTDARSDIYALGATLYTALTAQEPPESIVRSREDALIPARQLNPAIPPQVEAAIVRAMALVPDNRFQSAAEFKATLFPSAPPMATVTGDVATRVSEVVAPGAVTIKEPTTGRPITGGQARKPRSVWKVVAPVMLLVALIILIGGWLAFTAWSQWNTGGPDNETAQALAISTGVQQTRIAQEAATLLARETGLAATGTAMTLGQLPSANETLQVMQSTLQAQQTALAQQQTQPATPLDVPTQASPVSQATLAPLMITDWRPGFFVPLSSGCYFDDLPCWRTDDDYDKHQGSVMALVSEDSIFIDSSWSNPHLVFWHRYDLAREANITVMASGQWDYLKIYQEGAIAWTQAFFDLSKYKGESIIIQFATEGKTQRRWPAPAPKGSDWYIQAVQIVPDFAPPP
ncbi:MAG: serine/threonine protein kinase [Anaerolineales bacterium]|nr:serine/threonine protein kinase [Anaerolineales bacterium]